MSQVEETEHGGTPAYTLADAPADDEPFDPEDIRGLEDEPLVPHDEVARRLQR